MPQTWTFLDYTSYGTTSAKTVAEAYHLTGSQPATEPINVAFILPRANDPTALLASDWGARQATLAQLEADEALWTTYGASEKAYQDLRTYLGPHGKLIGDETGSDGYVSSPQSRTVWVTLDPDEFAAVFGTPLSQGNNGLIFWNDGLTLPEGVAGLWFDLAPWAGPRPAIGDLAPPTGYSQPQGAFSIGNGLTARSLQPDRLETNALSGEVARWFYDYPLTGTGAQTATVGLIEALVGTAGTQAPFGEALAAFRARAGVSTPGSFYLVANGGQSSSGDIGERSLDVGVVSSASPGSPLGLYAGSGVYDTTEKVYANSSVFTAYQAAFWDTVHRPPVVSSSFGLVSQPAPGSPFAYAIQQLFIDAALANITLVQANNDFGSSWGFLNGLANQTVTLSSPYVLLVGGTSITTLAAAGLDPTVSGPVLSDSLYGRALAGDLSTLWLLVQGGLTQLPSAVAPADSGRTILLEAVWNSYALSGNVVTPSAFGIGAGDGGVDTTQPTPWYQSAFGLTPTSANPGHATGRGAPDVAANAGGNLFYETPDGPMDKPSNVQGTSAAAPMWSSLLAQIDTIFQDQGLPHLGFMNDLLYTAAAIAPASFNDIVFGNNITSTHMGGSLFSENGSTLDAITLTGFGYQAGPGYDLATGLGTPNGVQLARALTAIAHHLVSFAALPDLIDADGQGGWTSGADQSLLVQAMSAGNATVGVTLGSEALGFSSAAAGSFAWSNQLAQQSLQPDFDPRLVILFDRQSQGALAQSTVEAGDSVAVSLNGSSAQAIQGTLSSPFGFADFFTNSGDVRVSRAVTVAETVGGLDDQAAIVRVRQNGENALSVTFYRVDDFDGSIDGKRPGEAGYLAAADARAYQLASGGTALAGPGYGNYTQSALLDVDAGDLIAMKLVNQTTGAHFWSFAHANETVDGQAVGHLWNYGLHTWGWEDTFGGGDRDFNDLVVAIDPTSAYGHAWLM